MEKEAQIEKTTGTNSTTPDPRLPTPDSRFHTTRRIEFCDTDMAGIVHFSNFFRFMEAAEVEFLRGGSLSVRLAWEGEEIGFPRVSASCDYLSPAYFEDILDVAVSVENIGRKSVTFLFEFTRAGLAVARGRVTSVCCRILPNKALESLEIPESYRKRLMGIGPG